MNSEHSTKADLLLVLVTLLAAVGWIFSSQALQGITPLWFLGTRFFLAGIILAILAGRRWQRVTAKQLLMSSKVGVFMAIALCIWIQALYMTDHIGEGSFITSMGVVFVPVFARVLFKENPPRATWFAMPIAILGFAFISLNSLNPDDIHFSADQWIFLIAATIFSFNFSYISKVAPHVSSWILASVQLTLVGLIGMTLALFTEPFPVGVTSDIWGWIIAAAVISSAMRFQLQTYAQGLTPASHAAVIMVLEPVWVVIIAAGWLGEALSINQVIGCGLIFCALLINRWKILLRLNPFKSV